MRAQSSDLTLERDAFDSIAKLAHREFGLHIAPDKIKMVQSRLRHRVAALRMPHFGAYSALVCSPEGGDERRSMISALTTNVSHFFREPHHFELMSKHLRQDLPNRARNDDRVRVWSAGCSNGQEPYSIAMHLLRTVPEVTGTDFRILATDIDPEVITFAQKGLYSSSQTTALTEQDKSQFLAKFNGDLRVKPEVSDFVSFRELNLLSRWPMHHKFDVIFCRNVLIYFDLKTQEKLWPRFFDALKPGGLLFLGHSERIARPAEFGFKTVGMTSYRKVGIDASALSHMHGGQNGTS